MTKPVQIRNEKAVREIRELARLRNKPVTEVVAAAVGDHLRREHARQEFEARMKAVNEIVEQVKRLPKLGPVPTDADFYDEDGFPK